MNSFDCKLLITHPKSPMYSFFLNSILKLNNHWLIVHTFLSKYVDRFDSEDEYSLLFKGPSVDLVYFLTEQYGL